MNNQKKKSNFIDKLSAQKKWWITPILIVLVLIIALIIFGKNPNIAPFLYERF